MGPPDGQMPGMSAPPPDPLELMLTTLRDLEPMQLRAFLASLRKKERDMLVQLVQDDDELSEKLNAAMPLPADYEPERPRWYKAPPKPEIATILTTARKDYDAYLDVRTAFKDDFKAYMNQTWGQFAVDQSKDTATSDATAFVSTALSSEINMRAAMLAEHDITYQVPPLSPDLQDETQKAENFLYYMDDLAERRHANRAGGSFKYDVALSFQLYGRAIVRRVLDLDDPDDPLDEVLIDPATCCPIWGGKHGLARVTRWYSDEIINVCRDYGLDSATLTKPGGMDHKGQPFKELSIENTVNVIEWWDEDYYAVLTEDGRTIKAITRHKYGEVPFVVQLVSRGLPAMFTDPSQKVQSDPGDPVGTQRRNDMKYKGMGAIHWLKFTHRQREAYGGKMYDALLRTDNPSIWLGMDTFAKTRAASKLGTRRGKVYPYDKDHEFPQIPQTTPAPMVTQPLVELLGADWSMSALPLSSYGSGEANQSGAALDGLTEGGNSKLTVDALAIENFYQRRGEQTLRWWKDWGRLVEDAEGRYGVFTIPVKRRTPAGPASFELTPDIIERIGTRVKVKLTNIRLAQLGAIGAAFAQLVQNDFMTERDAIERLGSPNPEEVMSERMLEKMRKDPRAQSLQMLAALLASTGDPIDPKELAQLMTKLFAQDLMGALGGGGGGSGPGQAPPQQAGPPGMATPSISQGVNMGNYGAPPGANGGDVGRPSQTTVIPPPGAVGP